MSFIFVLLAATAAAILLRKPLKRCPWAFYALAVLLNVLYAANACVELPDLVRKATFLLMQKCTLSLALFAIVMYIGAFRADSRIGSLLRPVRAELSIVACLLAVGHMAAYLPPLLPRTSAGALDVRFAVFFGTIALLTVLLVVLGVTSFERVKRRMSASAWKRLQKGAYVFFGLAYVHLMSILLPAAMAGGAAAREAVVVYTALFGAYALARIGHAFAERRGRTTAPSPDCAGGAGVLS